MLNAHTQPTFARFLPPADKRTSADAFGELQREFIDVALADPAKPVRTPGFKDATASVAELVDQGVLGTEPLTITTEMLRLVAVLARGPVSEQQQREQHMRAKALLGTLAEAHAGYHCGDLAAELEGGAA